MLNNSFISLAEKGIASRPIGEGTEIQQRIPETTMMCHRWIICFVVTCGCTTGKSVLETEMPNMVVTDCIGTVTALDNSDSYWSHTIAIKVPKLLETDKHGPFCKQKVRPEQAEIMACICLMYGHTFKAYEETRAMLINEVNRKTKLLEGLIPTGRIQGARTLLCLDDEGLDVHHLSVSELYQETYLDWLQTRILKYLNSILYHWRLSQNISVDLGSSHSNYPHFELRQMKI